LKQGSPANISTLGGNNPNTLHPHRTTVHPSWAKGFEWGGREVDSFTKNYRKKRRRPVEYPKQKVKKNMESLEERETIPARKNKGIKKNKPRTTAATNSVGKNQKTRLGNPTGCTKGKVPEPTKGQKTSRAGKRRKNKKRDAFES